MRTVAMVTIFPQPIRIFVPIMQYLCIIINDINSGVSKSNISMEKALVFDLIVLINPGSPMMLYYLVSR